MFGRLPRLTCKDVKYILGELGFEKKTQKGSHQQWVRYQGDDDERIYKVTVDCPKAPFGPTLLTSMISQSGFSKNDFLSKIKNKNKRWKSEDELRQEQGSEDT